MRKSMNQSCSINVQLQSGRGQGKVPGYYREDGRHPKYEDHGRIAGMLITYCDSVPQSVRMVFVVSGVLAFAKHERNRNV